MVVAGAAVGEASAAVAAGGAAVEAVVTAAVVDMHNIHMVHHSSTGRAPQVVTVQI